MNDTPKEISILYNKMIMTKSPIERLKMGFSMYDFSRQIIEDRINNQNKKIKATDKRKNIFLAFYANDFNEKQRQKIMESL